MFSYFVPINCANHVLLMRVFEENSKFFKYLAKIFIRNFGSRSKNFIELYVKNCSSCNKINFDIILISNIQLSEEKLFEKSRSERLT